MQHLTSREQELVALGAALASNCVPCIESHIPKARQAGLNDFEIREAVDLADALRQVPARKVLNTALAILASAPDSGHAAAAAVQTAKPCCGA
jgi:4-carboxymuconolactone decarboxylase